MSKYGSGTLVSPNKNKQKIDGTKAPFPKQSKYKKLPHIDMDGYYQFITFRTYDSIDDYMKTISNQDVGNSKKQYLIDNYLDTSKNGNYLKDDISEYMYNFLISKDNILYELVSFAIMSNHIHLLIKPLDKLENIMKILKGSSANQINKLLNKKGKFWANNYYDKAIRDEKHFFVVYEYIKNNCLKIDRTKVQFPKRFYSIYN